MLGSADPVPFENDWLPAGVDPSEILAVALVLSAVADDYDFVCIDTPPSLGLLTINALTAANKVIVPVQCEYLSMRGLIQLQNTLQMIRENLNPALEVEGVVLTMYDDRTNLAQQVAADVGPGDEAEEDHLKNTRQKSKVKRQKSKV